METLGSYLAEDHDRCDALFREAHHAVLGADWNEAARAMGAFQHALERHLIMEERIVYPAFERALGHAMAPTAAMRAEHLRIRGMTQRMADSVRERDRGAFVKHAEVLLLVMYQHGEKEEGVLYPMIERVLAHSCRDLVSAMRAFGTYDVCASAA